MTPTVARLPWTRIDWLVVALIVILATVIRVGRIDEAPSADEVWQMALTTGEGSPVGRYASDRVYVDAPGETTLAQAPPVWRVWATMGGVQHPPLYHITLRLWREAFGGGDMVAHAYSIAWAAVAVGFTCAAARLAMDRGAAIAVGAIYAVAPVQIYFAQEIRNYSMLIGIAAIATWVATRIETRGQTRGRTSALAAITLPLVLTHYFAAGMVAAIAAYGLFRFHGAPRRTFAGTLFACAIAYAVVWVPFAREQFSTIHTFDDYTKVDHFDVAGEAWWTIAAPARLLVEGFWLDNARYAWPALAVGGACLALPWFLARRLRPLLPWVAILAGTALFMAGVDAARTTWLTQLIRYLAAASPVVPLLIVGIPWALRPLAGYWVGVVATLALLVIPRGRLAVVADSPYYGDMATWARANVPPGDALIVPVGGGNAGVTDHVADLLLMTLAHEPGLFPRTIAKLTRPPTDGIRDRLPESGWVFLPGATRLPDDPILRTLELRAVVGLPNQGIVARYGLHRFPSRIDGAMESNAPATRPAIGRNSSYLDRR